MRNLVIPYSLYRMSALLLGFLFLNNSLLFPVSGSVFVKYGPKGPIFGEPGLTNHFDDLAMGRESTGFRVNFTRFSVTYLPRGSLTNTSSVSNGLDALTNSDPYIDLVRTTTPGYIRFSKLKFGPVEMAAGFLWQNLMTARRLSDTIQEEAQFSYNDIYLDYSWKWKIADFLQVGIRDDNRLVLAVQSGDSRYVANPDTNSASAFGYHVRLPLNAVFDLGWLLSDQTLYMLRDEKSYSVNGNPEGSLNTNRNMASSLTSVGWYGRNMVRFNGSIGLYLYAGIDYSKDIMTFYASNQTRTYAETASVLSIPLYCGLVYNMVPGITWTLGAGYVFTPDNGYQLITNGVTNSARMDSIWSSSGTDDKNYPFCSVGIRGSGGNIEVGLFYTVRLEISDINGEATLAGYTVSARDFNPLTFVHSVNYDENVYVKWSYEGLEIKGVLSAVPGANSIMNLLSSLRLAVYF